MTETPRFKVGDRVIAYGHVLGVVDFVCDDVVMRGYYVLFGRGETIFFKEYDLEPDLGTQQGGPMNAKADPLTTAEKVELLALLGNEVAFGYNDSGCFWHMRYGNRGAGNMIAGIGKTLNAPDEYETFAGAIDYFFRHFEEKGMIP